MLIVLLLLISHIKVAETFHASSELFGALMYSWNLYIYSRALHINILNVLRQ